MLIDHFSFPTWTQKPKISTKTTARLEILQQTAENIRSESFPICIVVRKINHIRKKKTPQVIQSDLLIQSDHITTKRTLWITWPLFCSFFSAWFPNVSTTKKSLVKKKSSAKLVHFTSASLPPADLSRRRPNHRQHDGLGGWQVITRDLNAAIPWQRHRATWVFLPFRCHVGS